MIQLFQYTIETCSLSLKVLTKKEQVHYCNSSFKKRGKRVDKALEGIRRSLLERKRELEEKLSPMAREKVSDDQVQDPGDQALSSSKEALKPSFQDTEISEFNRFIQSIKKIE